MTKPPLQGPPESLAQTVEVMFRDERRSSPRVALALKVDLLGANTLYAGVSNDIGQGGIFVAMRGPLPVGTRLDLRLYLEDGAPPLELHGTVRWSREPGPLIEGPQGIGIQFEELPDADRRRLEAVMKERDTLLWEP
jgi:uncharacterized protein (TIGR02266 family)